MANRKRNLQSEVDALRARVEKLAAAQQEPAAATPPPTGDEVEPDASSSGDLQSKFEELFRSLQADIDQTPTTTCLAIFGLGILVGRTLAS